jgi:ribA/ribD-fused uncharacterized protein
MNETLITFSSVNLPWGFLGNMSPYPITYKEQAWLTSEALFQSLRFESIDLKEIIRTQKSPMAAKMMAKKYKNQMTVLPMSNEDLENMRFVLKLKFDSHTEIKNRLINSAKYLIIEDIGNRNGERHLFWGMKKKNGNWVGENKMGKLLMELRKKYQDELQS